MEDEYREGVENTVDDCYMREINKSPIARYITVDYDAIMHDWDRAEELARHDGKELYTDY